MKLTCVFFAGDPGLGQQDPRDGGDDQHDEDASRVLSQFRPRSPALHQQVAHLPVKG